MYMYLYTVCLMYLGVVAKDPLNFCELFPENLPWCREAEVKHGRVAMLAYAGLVLPDFFRFPDPIFKQTGLDAISAHNMLLGGAGRGAMWCLLLFPGIE